MKGNCLAFDAFGHYKRDYQEEPLPSSHKLTSIAKVFESFSKFQVC
jgi:hypothetical protein